MGYEIHRWVREALPQDCSILERAVACQIAIAAGDTAGKPDFRETWVTVGELATWTGAKNEASVRDALKRLAVRGWDFRKPMGVGKDGRTLYAVPGRKLTFRVPDPRASRDYPLESETPQNPTSESPRASRDSLKGESPLLKGESGLLQRESGLAPETLIPVATSVLPEVPSVAADFAEAVEPWDESFAPADAVALDDDSSSEPPEEPWEWTPEPGAFGPDEPTGGLIPTVVEEQRIAEGERPSGPEPLPAPALVGEVREAQPPLAATPSRPAHVDWRTLVKEFGGARTIQPAYVPVRVDVRAPMPGKPNLPPCQFEPDPRTPTVCARCEFPQGSGRHRASVKAAPGKV